MRVVVHLKQVLDPHGILVNRRAGKVFFNREEYLMNPADRNALEAALQLKDADAKVEIVVLGCVPESGEAVLRAALGMGADHAIRLIDTSKSGDGAATADVVAAAVRRLSEVDLVLTGASALDLGPGDLGARLAQALSGPAIVEAYGVRVEGDTVQAVVREGDGYVTVSAPLPAVVTIARDANRPRYANAPRLARAYREASVDCWDATDLDLEPAGLEPRLARGDAEAPPELDKARVVSELTEVVALLQPFAHSAKAR